MRADRKQQFMKIQTTMKMSVSQEATISVTRGHNQCHKRPQSVSQEATISEVVLDDDICDGIKYKLNVVSVCCYGELRVDVFRFSTLIQPLKLLFNVGARLLECVSACKHKVTVLHLQTHLLKPSRTTDEHHSQDTSMNDHINRNKTTVSNLVPA